MLVIARFLQGIGGALSQPPSLFCLHLFHQKTRESKSFYAMGVVVAPILDATPSEAG
jgi:hypothetical protein